MLTHSQANSPQAACRSGTISASYASRHTSAMKQHSQLPAAGCRPAGALEHWQCSRLHSPHVQTQDGPAGVLPTSRFARPPIEGLSNSTASVSHGPIQAVLFVLEQNKRSKYSIKDTHTHTLNTANTTTHRVTTRSLLQKQRHCRTRPAVAVEPYQSALFRRVTLYQPVSSADLPTFVCDMVTHSHKAPASRACASWLSLPLAAVDHTT